MQRKYMRLILLSVLLFSLSACGSTRSDDVQVDVAPRDLGSDASGVAFVGADRCVNCHTLYALGNEQVTAYLASNHVQHSTAIHAGSSPDCLSCHDPIGDGRTLEQFIPPSSVPELGLAAVGCENCHGAGGEHLGGESIPTALPGVTECGACHSLLPADPAGHAGVFANSILEKYTNGNHANTLKGDPRDLCSRCHSDEGFRSFIGLTAGMDADQLLETLSDEVTTTPLSSVQCRSCHDSHSGKLRVLPSGEVAVGATVAPFSQGFNLCTSCHQVFLTFTFEPLTGLYSYTLDNSRRPYHGVSNDPLADPIGWVIWDTHFSDPDNAVAGYNINAASEQACTNCHDPHTAN